MRARTAVALVLAALPASRPSLARAQDAPAPAAAPAAASGLPVQGAEAEAFLRTAKVVRRKAIGKGITGSDQLTLSDGAASHRAVWKTIDESRRGVTTFPGVGAIVDYEDSYRFEIAAYELDKMLGFGLVPPTVERTIGGRRGALQMWIEGAMTEGERKRRGLSPPDHDAWNAQIHRLRLFHQLTFDWDAQNIENTLFDASFRVYGVDFSRSFAVYEKVRREQLLERFSRRDLDALRGLDEAKLRAAIGEWVSVPQVRALLKRRDQILEIAARRIAEKGEAAVLLP
ncbi:MAG: hypothetical protein U0599_26075 [Vicinamibacteria bacterium]